MSVEEWSVVPPRDRQAKQRQAHGSEKREASNGAGDESLIGSYVYRLDRSPLTPLDSDLIGAPFVISEPDQDNERGIPNSNGGSSNGGGRGSGGLLKLTPTMVQEIERERSTQAEFSLSSTSDWPAFTGTHSHTSTDPTPDSKSWSTVLKTPALPPPPKPIEQEGNHSDSVSNSDGEGETPKKKKKKKKKKKDQEGLIKDKQPLTLELGALFENLQVKSTSSKKVVFSTGGGLAVNKAPPTLQVHTARAELTGTKTAPRGNILDSTAPQIRRGKEREQPKKRKPTPLRKVIDKEREVRKNKTKDGGVEAAKSNTIDKTTEVEILKNETEAVELVATESIEAPNDETDDGEEVTALCEELNTPVGDHTHQPHPPSINHHIGGPHPPTTDPLLPVKPHPPVSSEDPVKPHPPLSSDNPVKPQPPLRSEDPVKPHPPLSSEDPVKPHPPVNPSKPKTSIHNRRFREYCTHVVTEEINQCAQTLLSELLRFQDRQFLKDPIKAKVKKRYVCGMREVLKHLKSRRVKCLIVAPNMDRIQSEGGLDDVIGQILSLAEDQGMPIIFAMSRRRLAVTLKKSHKVGCVGVFRYEGAESHYKRLLELVEEASGQYKTQSTALQATPTHPPLPLVDSDSDGEIDSTSKNQNETIDSSDLIHSPWGVFFNQRPTLQVGNSPSDVHTHEVSTDKGLVHQSLTHTPHVTPVPSHVINVNSHVTSQFNVFAKEFVPLSLNVNAPEFRPES